MSDPTYNRKQGVQKYWAMFQRERRKKEEQIFRINALQIPLWDYSLLFYPQLIACIKNYNSACAVFIEMFSFVEGLFVECEASINISNKRISGLSVEQTRSFLSVEEKKRQFREWFVLDYLGEVVSTIVASSNTKYMDKIRLRNIFPATLDENVFEQWGVADKFPKAACETSGVGSKSEWCNHEVFKKYYDQILTQLEFIDTACKDACGSVAFAESRQSAAFKNYFNIKRQYGEIMANIRHAVAHRTADGMNEFKSIENWAREFGFGVDASYELLYKAVSTDNENYDRACPKTQRCLSREEVQIELDTEFDPHNVSLSELEEFIGTKLRPSAEGTAARSLAFAEMITNIRKSFADKIKVQFSACRSEFTSFINVWKTNFCLDTSGAVPLLPSFDDLQAKFNQSLPSKVELTTVHGVAHDSERAQKEIDDINAVDDKPRGEELRRIWAQTRRQLNEVRAEQDDAARKTRQAEEDAKFAEQQERLADLIVQRLASSQEQVNNLSSPKVVPPTAPELPPVATELPPVATVVENGADANAAAPVNMANVEEVDAEHVLSNAEDGYLSDHGF